MKQASEAEEIRGADDEGLQKMIEIATGTEVRKKSPATDEARARLALARVEQSSACASATRAETGDGRRPKILSSAVKPPFGAGINKNRSLGAGSAERSGNEHAGEITLPSEC